MTNIVNKWKKTGLLDATNPQDHFELSNMLEDLAQHLINRKADELQKKIVSENTTEEIAGIILPILVRMYNERRDVCPTDMEKFYKEFVKDYDSHKALIDDLNSYIAQDGEREFCEMYVKGYKA